MRSPRERFMGNVVKLLSKLSDRRGMVYASAHMASR